jgi:hypothetical protein
MYLLVVPADARSQHFCGNFCRWCGIFFPGVSKHLRKCHTLQTKMEHTRVKCCTLDKGHLLVVHRVRLECHHVLCAAACTEQNVFTKPVFDMILEQVCQPLDSVIDCKTLGYSPMILACTMFSSPTSTKSKLTSSREKPAAKAASARLCAPFSLITSADKLFRFAYMRTTMRHPCLSASMFGRYCTTASLRFLAACDPPFVVPRASSSRNYSSLSEVNR